MGCLVFLSVASSWGISRLQKRITRVLSRAPLSVFASPVGKTEPLLGGARMGSLRFDMKSCPCPGGGAHFSDFSAPTLGKSQNASFPFLKKPCTSQWGDQDTKSSWKLVRRVSITFGVSHPFDYRMIDFGFFSGLSPTAFPNGPRGGSAWGPQGSKGFFSLG